MASIYYDKYNGCISAGGKHTVGLKADGTVVAVGSDEEGQCDVSGWRDIGPVSKERLAEEHRLQSKRWEEQGLCRHCGGRLGGVFTKKCKSCGKEN